MCVNHLLLNINKQMLQHTFKNGIYNSVIQVATIKRALFNQVNMDCALPLYFRRLDLTYNGVWSSFLYFTAAILLLVTILIQNMKGHGRA